MPTRLARVARTATTATAPSASATAAPPAASASWGTVNPAAEKRTERKSSVTQRPLRQQKVGWNWKELAHCLKWLFSQLHFPRAHFSKGQGPAT